MKKLLRRGLCLLAALCLLCGLDAPVCAGTPENGAAASAPLTRAERAELEKSLIDRLCIINDDRTTRFTLENDTDYTLRDVAVLRAEDGSRLYGVCELPPHTSTESPAYGNLGWFSDGSLCYLRYVIGDYYYVTGDYPVHAIEEGEYQSGKLPELQLETDGGMIPLPPGQTVDLSGESFRNLQRHTLESACLSLDGVFIMSGRTVYLKLALQGGPRGENWDSLYVRAYDEEGYLTDIAATSLHETGMSDALLHLPLTCGRLTLRLED